MEHDSAVAVTVAAQRTMLNNLAFVEEPLFMPSGRDDIDMRLLWFYTTHTWTSYSTGSLRFRDVEEVLRVHVVQHAFANPFLMDCLLGLSAMHLNRCGIPSMGVPRTRELLYRAKAFETYRKAVEAADPATFPALLACSVLLCGLSTDGFRGESARPLYLLDWMVLWRGIGAIVSITGLPRLFQSGVAALIYRPEVDLDASVRHVPSHLLSMVASIEQGDPDLPFAEAYSLALKHLGSLYLELRHGPSELLMLRIVIFFTYLSAEFVDAARRRRPRALVILAHYLVFTKLSAVRCWWMQDVADHEIPSICGLLGPGWAHMLRVPVTALPLTDMLDIARLLLNDPCWKPPQAAPGNQALARAPDRELETSVVIEGGEMSVEVRRTGSGKSNMG